MDNHSPFTTVSATGTITLIVVLITSTVFSGRPPLCQTPIHWMVDQHGLATLSNGSYSPIAESKGNVSVIFFLKAAESADQVQASRMKDMVNFLRSTGLTDIKFFVINSREANSRQLRSLLTERVSGSDIHVYQETDDAPIWDKLKGDRGDLFIYDRCARLTYYIPSPLSMLSARAPIAQATILSAYFDDPCNSSCNHLPPISSPKQSMVNLPETDSTNASTTIFSDEVDISDISTPDPFEDLLDSPSNYSDVQYGTRINIVDSNSTTIEERREMNDTRNGHVMLQPWKIFEFFLADPNNQSEHQNNFTGNVVSTTTEIPRNEGRILRSNESSLTTSSAPKHVNSSVLLIVPTCDANQCVEFSTDSILRARLCCLREDVGSDGEATFGCRTYNRISCKQMLPLIKCCLKDFSQLLANYFRNQRSGRKQNNSGNVG